MQNHLMQQGVELMLYGMGTVFVFLALLIVVTTIMSSLVQRFVKPEPVAVPPTVLKDSGASDEQLIAVISTAIHKYRSRHK